MKQYFQTSISALALSAMVLGGVMATVSISAAPAFSQGNSAGNGNGNANRNENNNRGGRNNNDRGVTASSLGALNAIHANAIAFANASENSPVGNGMIAIYKLAVEATAEASAAFDAAELALNIFIAQCDPGATDPLLSPDQCQDLLDAATESAQLAADEGVVVTPFTYESYVTSLEQAVADADAAQADAKVLEDMALEAAANKVTNKEVIAALWDLLELPTL
jgi:hypothetical protein